MTGSVPVPLWREVLLRDLPGPEGPHLLVPRPTTKATQPSASQASDHSMGGGRGSSCRRIRRYQPADERDDARQRIEPHPVRTAQPRLPLAQHGHGDDLRQRLDDHHDGGQQLDERGQVGVAADEEADGRDDAHGGQAQHREAVLGVELAVRTEEDAVACGVVRHPRAAEEPGEDGREGGDEDQDGDGLGGALAPGLLQHGGGDRGGCDVAGSVIRCQSMTPRVPICSSR